MESVTLATEPVSRYAPHLTFFLSAIFFRSAWKYRDRAYRYHLLDTGHLAENILLALKAASIPHELSYDFDDRMVNQLLGLNETKEVCLAVCHVPGREPLEKAPDPVKIPELDPSIGEASRVAGEEIDYTPIGKIHKAGTPKKSLPEPVSPMVWNLGLTAERHEPIHTPGHWPESLSLADAFHQRRSRRNFVPREMPIDCLMSLLDALCTAEPRDQTQSILGTGLLVGRAEGMAAGFYLLDAANKHAALVRAGSFIEPMARICLNQEWLKHAAVHFLFLTNLDRLDRLCGARGYRYAMLAAGRLGQRVYLAATAMAMGCCGIGAFYDGEAAELLGLTQGSKLLYLVAAGPVKSLEADRS
jgi:SagB-type dehydrogenase family enzyme